MKKKKRGRKKRVREHQKSDRNFTVYRNGKAIVESKDV